MIDYNQLFHFQEAFDQFPCRLSFDSSFLAFWPNFVILVLGVTFSFNC